MNRFRPSEGSRREFMDRGYDDDPIIPPPGYRKIMEGFPEKGARENFGREKIARLFAEDLFLMRNDFQKIPDWSLKG